MGGSISARSGSDSLADRHHRVGATDGHLHVVAQSGHLPVPAGRRQRRVQTQHVSVQQREARDGVDPMTGRGQDEQIAAGAAGVGVGSAVNKLGDELAMVAVVRGLREALGSGIKASV